MEERKLNTETNKKEFNEAMVFDTEESLDEKKKLWDDIFLTNPDLSDMIIELYKDLGIQGLIKLSSIFKQIAEFLELKNN